MVGKLLLSLRQKTRYVFRRLSWIVGVLFAFISSIILAVISPSLMESGVAKAHVEVVYYRIGTLISPELFTIGEFSMFILWTVVITMCFGVGFMVMRTAGWLIESLIPHSRRRTESA